MSKRKSGNLTPAEQFVVGQWRNTLDTSPDWWITSHMIHGAEMYAIWCDRPQDEQETLSAASALAAYRAGL